GTVITTGTHTAPADRAAARPPSAREPQGRAMAGTGVALTLAALAWGLVNYGVLLWLPAALVAEGRSVALASTIIARSTLIAVPAVLSLMLVAIFGRETRGRDLRELETVHEAEN